MANQTYSFGAPADFGARLATAREAFIELGRDDAEVADWLQRELAMEFARIRHRRPQVAQNQSAFMRAILEAIVRVTEEVAEGLEMQKRHRELQARVGPDPESAAWAESAARGAAEAWRE